MADALGDRNAVAPFFRIPRIMRSETIEHYLADRSLIAGGPARSLAAKVNRDTGRYSLSFGSSAPVGSPPCGE